MNAPVTIKPMNEAHLEAVHTLETMCFATPWPLKSFRYELEENNAARMWVAAAPPDGDQPERVIGMIVVWLLVDLTHIATLAVHPDFRRQRIAYRLVCTALRETLAEGANAATLEVRASNQAAQHLYRRFGFQLVGRRPGYYQDNHEDAILMTLHDMDEIHLQTIRCMED